MNKKKIFNDPVYGFISIPYQIIYDLVEHPYFQRLRRIHQLALTHYVYPGALHTRFQHALGAMHLMGKALSVLKSKGHSISEAESAAATIAILLHDIGHGPYSHTLEKSIVSQIPHEYLSLLFMERLNKQFKGKLSLAIEIFKGTYKKKFLHQLVSSQLDMDRMDYLNRDSFFTGVHEGVIGYDRIIEMLDIHKDSLVVEAKGVYSIEKFIIARRLMYWQVYLHKTVLVAEQLLVVILQRAKDLVKAGERVDTTPALEVFLRKTYTKKDFMNQSKLLDVFAALDDYDVFSSVKIWQNHPDRVLSMLSKNMIDRKLPKVELTNEKPDSKKIGKLNNLVKKKYKISEEEVKYFVFLESTSNYAYNPVESKINILFKDGTIKDIAEASDQLNISMLASKPVTKYYLCYPKGL